jgi:hypothetical protein
MLAGLTALLGGGGGGGGSFESIATFTASGGETSTTFSSIASTYKHLQIRGIYRDTTTGGYSKQLGLRFNGDTASSYPYHAVVGDGSTAYALGNSAQTQLYTAYSGTDSSMNANCFGGSIIDIHNYTSTTNNKTLRHFGGVNDNVADTNRRIGLSSGAWLSTSAITSITLIPASAFAAGTTFALYGIKG